LFSGGVLISVSLHWHVSPIYAEPVTNDVTYFITQQDVWTTKVRVYSNLVSLHNRTFWTQGPLWSKCPVGQ